MDGIQTIIDLPAGGIPADSLAVVWHDQSPPISTIARERLEERWAEYVAEAQRLGKVLFNGRLTRFLAAAWEGGTLRLDLAATDYKTFVVTCIRDHAWFKQNAPDAIAGGLGNSVLLTQHHQALLGIRSPQVSAYANRAHLIGGVLEALATPEFPASWHGIVAHLSLELREELGVQPADLLPQPRLLAIVHEEFLAQPELIWQWETIAPIAEIARHMQPAEHAEMVILQKKPINEKLLATMTPLARAAVRNWHREAIP